MKKEEIIIIVIGIVSIIGVAILFDKALTSSEIQECNTLSKQAEEYKNFLYSKENQSGFYITKDQDVMCKYLGVKVNAPIK